MKVHHISHACHILESSRTRIIFDPVFFEISKTGYKLFPQARVNAKKIAAQEFDAIFISHFHEDHFCLRSLKLFDRKTPVYFFGPLDSELHYLTALGFQNVNRLQLGSKYRIHEMTVECIDNLESQIECGFLTRTKDCQILNLVDCAFSEKHIKEINKKGPFDLVFFPYQELNQESLCGGDFGASFDRFRYQERVNHASLLKTRLLVPGSCQIQYRKSTWRNYRAFPITPGQFIEDFKALQPKINTRELLPGDTVHFQRKKTSFGKSPLLVQTSKTKRKSYQHKPQLRVPSLAADFGIFHDEKQLQKALDHFHHEFPNMMTQARGLPQLKPFFKNQLICQIKIVGSKRKKKNFFLHFEKNKAHFGRRRNPHFSIQIHAQIFARNIIQGAPYVALLDGIRSHGSWRKLQMNTHNNPLLIYFLLTSKEKDRLQAVS